jgi:hypothetical protein
MDTVRQARSVGRVGSNVVKFVFPRGDATSLLFSFDAAGRITGVGVGGMAGAIDPAPGPPR